MDVDVKPGGVRGQKRPVRSRPPPEPSPLPRGGTIGRAIRPSFANALGFRAGRFVEPLRWNRRSRASPWIAAGTCKAALYVYNI